MTFNPQPKPVKESMTAKEFQRNHWNSTIAVKPKRSITKKKKKLYDFPAWTWFSRYIKLLYCNSNGMTHCATSGRLFHISSPDLHAGHCIKVYDGNSTNFNTAFDQRNVLPQCRQDNVYKGGKPEIMRDKIDAIHGKGTYQELVFKAKTPLFLRDCDYTEFARHYRIEVYELLKKKNIKKWW